MSKRNGKGTSCTHDIETGSHVNPFANTRAKLPVTKAVEVGRWVVSYWHERSHYWHEYISSESSFNMRNKFLQWDFCAIAVPVRWYWLLEKIVRPWGNSRIKKKFVSLQGRWHEVTKKKFVSLQGRWHEVTDGVIDIETSRQVVLIWCKWSNGQAIVIGRCNDCCPWMHMLYLCWVFDRIWATYKIKGATVVIR